MSIDLSSIADNAKRSYITLYGLKREQFNFDVISIQCTVNEILKLLEIDNDVQRDLDESKVANISKYIQYGLDGNNIYFSPLIFSARGKGVYDEIKKEYRLDINEKLIILDGQHRIKAFEYLKKRLKANGNEAYKYKMILNFPISIQVFYNLTLEQERQLFTDINTKSSQVNNTLLTMYKENDLCGKLVREIVQALPENLIECRAKTTRTKLMTASTLYLVAQTINTGIYSRQQSANIINEQNYNEYKRKTESYLTLLRKYAPIDASNRDKYIIMSSNIVLSIAKFIYEVQKKYSNISMEELFQKVIAKMDWSHKNEEFKKLSIKYNKRTKKYNLGSTGRTIRDFSQYLMNKYEK